MSDFRDPHNPVGIPGGYGHEYDHQAVRRMQAEAIGSAWGMGPIIGLLLLLGVLFFAFSTGDNQRVAQNDTAPPATSEPAPSGN
jgi:hypothetical protein